MTTLTGKGKSLSREPHDDKKLVERLREAQQQLMRFNRQSPHPIIDEQHSLYNECAAAIERLAAPSLEAARGHGTAGNHQQQYRRNEAIEAAAKIADTFARSREAEAGLVGSHPRGESDPAVTQDYPASVTPPSPEIERIVGEIEIDIANATPSNGSAPLTPFLRVADTVIRHWPTIRAALKARSGT